MSDLDVLEMYRKFLKSDVGDAWAGRATDKARGVPCPPSEKPVPKDATLIELTPVEGLNLPRMPLAQAIRRRRSRRQYTDASLSLDELSFLLWATQGTHKSFGKGYSLRTVPAGMAVHPFETYLSVHRVVGIEPGLYRYLPSEHRLCLLYLDASIAARAFAITSEDQLIRKCAVYFVWTAVPYRKEWRGSPGDKNVAIEAGHVCQNLYLASEAIGCGTCAMVIGWGARPRYDEFLGVDGRDEFTIYSAAVGKLKSGLKVEWSGQIGRVDADGNVARLWMKTYSFWNCDVFVVEFPRETVSGYAEGEYVGIRGKIVDMCSEYDGWPLVRGVDIEQRSEPFAGVDPLE